MSNYTYQHDPRISGADFEDDDDPCCEVCGHPGNYTNSICEGCHMAEVTNAYCHVCGHDVEADIAGNCYECGFWTQAKSF